MAAGVLLVALVLAARWGASWILGGSSAGTAGPAPAPPDAAQGPEGLPALAAAGGGMTAEAGAESTVTPAAATEAGSVVAGTSSARRGATIFGRAVDVAGQALEGVEVDLDRIRPIAIALGAGPGGRWDALLARTDADGRFRFDRVRPADHYRVRLRSRTAVLRREIAEVFERDVADLGTLILEPARAIRGRVVDVEGRGVARARVWAGRATGLPADLVLDDPARFPDPDAEATSGDDGSFTLVPVAGEASIVLARAPSGESGVGRPIPATRDTDEAPLRGTPGDEAVVVTVGGTAFVAGTVVDTSGAPVPGALVAVARPKEAAARMTRTTSAGPDGRFRLEHVPAGPCVVGALAGDLAPRWTLAVAPATDVRVRVPRGGRLLGRVVFAATGRPVEQFRIELEPVGRAGGGDDETQAWAGAIARERGPRAVVAADGRFDVGPLLSAPYLLVVHVDGCAPAGPGSVPDVPADGVADVGTIRVHEARFVRGRVVDATGAPVAGASVLALIETFGPYVPDDLERYADPTDSAIRTDADGGFEAGPLVPGVYVLGVRPIEPERPPTLSDPVRVAERDVSDARITLPGAGGGFTALCSVRGRPAVGGHLLLLHEGGERRAIDIEGSAQERWLREGRWLVAFLGRAARRAARLDAEGPERPPHATVWSDLRAVPGTVEVRIDRGEDALVRVEAPSLVRWSATIRTVGIPVGWREENGIVRVAPRGAPEGEELVHRVQGQRVDFGYEAPGPYVVWTEHEGERYSAEVTVPDAAEFDEEIVLRK